MVFTKEEKIHVFYNGYFHITPTVMILYHKSVLRVSAGTEAYRLSIKEINWWVFMMKTSLLSSLFLLRICIFF